MTIMKAAVGMLIRIRALSNEGCLSLKPRSKIPQLTLERFCRVTTRSPYQLIVLCIIILVLAAKNDT